MLKQHSQSFAQCLVFQGLYCPPHKSTGLQWTPNPIYLYGTPYNFWELDWTGVLSESTEIPVLLESCGLGSTGLKRNPQDSRGIHRTQGESTGLKGNPQDSRGLKGNPQDWTGIHRTTTVSHQTSEVHQLHQYLYHHLPPLSP